MIKFLTDNYIVITAVASLVSIIGIIKYFTKIVKVFKFLIEKIRFIDFKIIYKFVMSRNEIM
ncbi:hypothetical protein FACS189450_01640 [Spirochaetia bacterium]|nr:hypothetical protein FACS189450_01640 [Spirochaetia bacterium]